MHQIIGLKPEISAAGKTFRLFFGGLALFSEKEAEALSLDSLWDLLAVVWEPICADNTAGCDTVCLSVNSSYTPALNSWIQIENVSSDMAGPNFSSDSSLVAVYFVFYG